MKPGQRFFFEPLGEELVALPGNSCSMCVGDENDSEHCTALLNCDHVFFMRIPDAVTLKLEGKVHDD